ncbi:hypothetical protein JCM19294_1223 [Nonlabens tegetincola]|uniref:Uncharacterized protein n=1 Tax=Nonlabens tegetincola TaxID=323273 RepID=A0A090Q1E3_9FLAO|nr:hypothetical protein JCM19294_1223 [Nonlabens tegetincola]
MATVWDIGIVGIQVKVYSKFLFNGFFLATTGKDSSKNTKKNE